MIAVEQYDEMHGCYLVLVEMKEEEKERRFRQTEMGLCTPRYESMLQWSAPRVFIWHLKR